MADSLFFDGVDDQRVFSPGAAAGGGAFGCAVIIKPGALSGYDQILDLNGASAYEPLGYDAGALRFWDGTAERTPTGGVTLVTGEWYLVGVTKGAGAQAPRWHIYRYSTAVWVHNLFNGAAANPPTITSIAFGRVTGERFVGDLLIGGWWNSDLTAASAFEAQNLAKGGQAAWAASSPAEAWRFDSDSAITPFVGSSTQQGSSVGGTLSVGSAPTGWDKLPQKLSPDADTVTTGWSTAPLYSKLNDSSDATVIAATLA